MSHSDDIMPPVVGDETLGRIITSQPPEDYPPHSPTSPTKLSDHAASESCSSCEKQTSILQIHHDWWFNRFVT